MAQLHILDSSGQEVIRLHQDSNHQIQATAKDQLQYKGNRYYFKESIEQFHGEIYISPLDLNKKHGMIEQPYNPVIRLATPSIMRRAIRPASSSSTSKVIT